MATLTAIRQAAAYRLDGGFLASACTGGNTTTLIDTTRLQSSERSSDDYVGSWIFWAAGTVLAGNSNIRSIASYAPSTGTLTQSGVAWSGSPTATNAYELHTLIHPLDWVTAINNGLRKCTRLVRNELTIVTSQRQYALTALTSFVTDAHATRVLLRRGTVAAQYTWHELPDSLWDIYEDNDGYTLNLHTTFTNVTGQALFLETITPYDTALAAEADTTTCPLDWAVAAAMMSVWERHAKQIDERGRVGMDADQVTAFFREQSARFSPSMSKPVHLEPF